MFSKKELLNHHVPSMRAEIQRLEAVNTQMLTALEAAQGMIEMGAVEYEICAKRGDAVWYHTTKQAVRAAIRIAQGAD